MKLEVTSKVTREVLGSSSTSEASDSHKNKTSDPPTRYPKDRPKRKITEKDVFRLPVELKYIKGIDTLPRETQMKLALLAPAHVQRAIQNCLWKAKNGMIPKNEIGYLKETAIKMAKKDNYQINWAQLGVWKEAEKFYKGEEVVS